MPDLINALRCDETLYDDFYEHFIQNIDKYILDNNLDRLKGLIYNTKVIQKNCISELKIEKDGYLEYWIDLLTELDADDYKGISLEKDDDGEFIFLDDLTDLIEKVRWIIQSIIRLYLTPLFYALFLRVVISTFILP